MKELIFKSAQIIKDLDDKKGIVKGLGSVFGNKDSDGDVMVKGCYSKTLKENMSRMKYLYQHRTDKPIGTFSELKETDEGLEFVAKLALDTRLGADVYEMIKAGLITENSVGFRTVKDEYDREEKTNFIKEVKLYEISAVTFAANPMALIDSVKEAEGKTKEEAINEVIEERFCALEKLLKSNISDDLGLAVEFEIKSLKELALREITEPVDPNHSAEDDEAKAKAEELESINNFIKTL